MGRHTTGIEGERRAQSLLKSKGLKVSKRLDSSHDCLVNGKRLEIKLSNIDAATGEWNFNIHRHGKLNESGVDFYLLCLKDVPYTTAWIYIILKAPVNKHTIRITFSTLVKKYAPFVGNWDALR